MQEEIGLRGAEMIARRIKPDVAIITDVTHDTTTPMVSKIIQGDTACGKGPSLTFVLPSYIPSYVNNNRPKSFVYRHIILNPCRDSN